jgi:mono/diheme cytochrome c family protein
MHLTLKERLLRLNTSRAGRVPAHSYTALRSLLIGLLLIVALAACSGLGGEPRIVATQLPPTAAPQDLGYPAEPPDLLLGAQLFATNCTACHGTNGSGNGELVAAGQVSAPPDFTDPTNAADQTPADYFEVITNGRIENLMPPWRDALTESERWAVTLYTYTLAYGGDDLTHGEDVYRAECAECHGPNGEGDGERAAELTRPVIDLTDPIELTTLSDDALYSLVTEGVGDQMPAFGDDLSEDDRRAVVRYLRSLSLANTDVIGSAPEATLEPADLPESATVTGQIVNGTEGGELPDDLPVTLYRLEETADGIRDEAFETTTDTEGRFTLADVPLNVNSSYILSAFYRDRLFTGELLSTEMLLAEDGISLNVYEPTEDPSVITITSVTSTVNAVGDGLQVLQEFIFENNSDRVYTNSLQVGEGSFASVVVGLPPGAAGLAFAGASNRFVVSEEQQVVVDTVPVWPGRPHGVQLSYFIPYDGSGAVIEQPVYFNLDGTVRLLMWPPSLNITSEQLMSVGEQTVQGQTYDAYEGELTLAPGGTIRYDLSGQTQSTAAPQITPVGSNTTILLVGGLLIEIVLIVGVLYWYFRRRSRKQAAPPDRNTLIDGLIRQIAELDDAHDRGDMDDAAYDNQRSQLKARLTDLMNETPQK